MRQIEKDIIDFVKYNVEDSAYIYADSDLWVVDEGEDGDSELSNIIDYLVIGDGDGGDYFSMLKIDPKEEKIIVTIGYLSLNSISLSEETLNEIFDHIKKNVEKVNSYLNKKDFIRSQLFTIFSSFCDLDDADTLANSVFDRVKEDIEECADKEINESDVRMALGRLMLNYFCEED
jgi:hypothetical protein